MDPLPDLSKLSHTQKDELIVGLHAIVTQLMTRVTELEAKLSMNSFTSSKPLSSDGRRFSR